MISVIIPSYNSENTIKKCLDSLLNQSYDGEYEIILVDSSVDRTPEIVSSSYKIAARFNRTRLRRSKKEVPILSNHPNIKLIHLEQKTDPGTARNIGIGEAKGDLIAFIDSDCMAEHDWLEKIDSAHKSPYSVVGGVVNNGNGEDDLVALAGYISEFREFLPERPKQEVTHIPTCNISYKRTIFRDFGLFQGEYYPQEDLVYNYNLCKNGERILLDPAIQIYHHHRSRLKDFLSHQRKIGVITSKVLKVIPLEGSFIVQHPSLATFLIPFLPMVKFFRTLFVFLRFQPESTRKRPLVLLLFALGLIFWVTGFARGIYKKSTS